MPTGPNGTTPPDNANPASEQGAFVNQEIWLAVATMTIVVIAYLITILTPCPAQCQSATEANKSDQTTLTNSVNKLVNAVDRIKSTSPKTK